MTDTMFNSPALMAGTSSYPEAFPVFIHLRTTERKAAPLILEAMGYKGGGRLLMRFVEGASFSSALWPPSFSSVHLLQHGDTMRYLPLDSLAGLIYEIQNSTQPFVRYTEHNIGDTIPFTRRVAVAATPERYCIMDMLLGKLLTIRFPSFDEKPGGGLPGLVDLDSLWIEAWDRCSLTNALPEPLSKSERPIATILGMVAEAEGRLIIALQPNFPLDSEAETQMLQPPYRWQALLVLNEDAKFIELRFIDLTGWAKAGYTNMVDVGSFTLISDTLYSVVYKLDDTDKDNAFIGFMPMNMLNRSYTEVEFTYPFPSAMWVEGYHYMLHNGRIVDPFFVAAAYPLILNVKEQKTIELTEQIGVEGPFFDYYKLRYYLIAADRYEGWMTILTGLDGFHEFIRFSLENPTGTFHHSRNDLSGFDIDLHGTVVIHRGSVWGLDKSWSKLVCLSGFFDKE